MAAIVTNLSLIGQQPQFSQRHLPFSTVFKNLWRAIQTTEVEELTLLSDYGELWTFLY